MFWWRHKARYTFHQKQKVDIVLAAKIYAFMF
jgi:hypothetical protein